MRKHPEIGYNILKGIDFLEGAAQLVFQHHEKFDGTGYPQGLKGDQILLAARLFAVVGKFDAITSNRPYSKALSYHVTCYAITRLSLTLLYTPTVCSFLS